MEIFRLFGSIFIDSQNAEDNINNVGNTADNTGRTLGGMIGTAAKWGAGIAVGIGGAVTGLLALASAASDTASDIADMSVRTGLSTTRLQELKFASEQTGVNFDSFTSAIAKLTKNMGSAEDGGKKATEAFAALGISTKDVATGGLRSMDDIFPEVLEKLASMSNETERNALATKLFGGSATELVPLLAQGSEGIAELSQQAHDLGLVLSEDTIAAGDTFGDSLDAIKGAMGGVVTAIGAELMPKFQVLFDWILKHMPEIQAGIRMAFDVASKAISWLSDNVLPIVVGGFNKLGDAIGFVKRHMDIFLPILAGVTAAIAAQFIIGTVTSLMAAWRAITVTQTTVQWLLNAAMSANPIGVVALAIGALIAVGILLYKNWDTVKKITIETWDVVKRALVSVWDWVKGNWESLLLLLVNPFAGALKLLYDHNPKFKAWVDKLYHTIVDPIKALPGEVLELGKNIIEGLVNGMMAFKDKISDKVSELINKIPLTIRKIMGIASPSKVTHALGLNVAEGIGTGIVAGSADVIKTMQDLADKLKTKSVEGITKLGDAIMVALRKMYAKQRDLRLLEIDGIRDPEVQKRRDAIKALQDQTDEEERQAKLVSYLKGLVAKQQEIENEQDADKRIALQAEMNEMIAEHDRELLLESRKIQQEKLEGEIEAIEKGADEAKAAAEKNFAALSADEAVQAEARRLAMTTNNAEMITLLGTFNPDWQNAGQSWADSLLNGINSKKESIKTAVSDIMGMVKKANDAAAALASVLAPTATQQGPLGMGINAFIKTVVPQYADGTDYHPGGLAWVGEEGPELLNLPRGSRVTPNSELPSGAAITNHYTFAPGAIVIPAKDLAEMRTVQDFFARFTQVARAT